MSIHDAIKRVAGELLEEYEIVISVGHEYANVELYFEGDKIDYPSNHEGGVVAEIIDALEHALELSKRDADNGEPVVSEEFKQLAAETFEKYKDVLARLAD